MYTFTPSKPEKISQVERSARGSFELKIVSGNAHPKLSEAIARHIGVPLMKAYVGDYLNGETRVEIQESCRGCDIYIIQPICTDEYDRRTVNDHLMELMVLIKCLHSASAERITAVMPIYGYARQDKKDGSRASISARLVAELLQSAGISRAMTIDLHASQIQGFFSKPMDNLYAEDYLCAHMNHTLINKRGLLAKDIVVVSPDAGGAKRAMRVAKKLGVACAIIAKERLKANEVASMRLVGSVENKIAILVDDMADTCGTMCLACQTVKQAGATEVHAYVVHGVLSGPALERINACEELTSMVVTNTIPQRVNQKKCSKLHVVDISLILAEAIRRTHSHQSVSEMFVSPKLASVDSPKNRHPPAFSLGTTPDKECSLTPGLHLATIKSPADGQDGSGDQLALDSIPIPYSPERTLSSHTIESPQESPVRTPTKMSRGSKENTRSIHDALIQSPIRDPTPIRVGDPTPIRVDSKDARRSLNGGQGGFLV